MMNDNIVNLNRYRKAKARAVEEKQAAANRVKFGRTKAEKQTETSDSARVAELHDGLKLETPGKPE